MFSIDIGIDLGFNKMWDINLATRKTKYIVMVTCDV